MSAVSADDLPNLHRFVRGLETDNADTADTDDPNPHGNLEAVRVHSRQLRLDDDFGSDLQGNGSPQIYLHVG